VWASNKDEIFVTAAAYRRLINVHVGKEVGIRGDHIIAETSRPKVVE
jgi:hypothetical protein